MTGPSVSTVVNPNIGNSTKWIKDVSTSQSLRISGQNFSAEVEIALGTSLYSWNPSTITAAPVEVSPGVFQVTVSSVLVTSSGATKRVPDDPIQDAKANLQITVTNKPSNVSGSKSFSVTYIDSTR